MLTKKLTPAAVQRLYALDAANALTAKRVLAEATKASSPLHPYFEWNDGKAAAAHRLQQAYELIRAVRYVDTLAQNRAAPRVISTRSAKSVQRTAAPREFVKPVVGKPYKKRDTALDDDDLRKSWVRRRVNMLEQWVNESMDIQELSRLCTHLRNIIDKLRKTHGL